MEINFLLSVYALVVKLYNNKDIRKTTFPKVSIREINSNKPINSGYPLCYTGLLFNAKLPYDSLKQQIHI